MEKGRGKGTDTLQTDNFSTRKEYIEREAAKDAVCKAFVRWGSEDQYHESTHQIDRIPAADVVPVVRCKECANKFDWPWCGMFPDDGYCSAGARMDGDEK